MGKQPIERTLCILYPSECGLTPILSVVCCLVFGLTTPLLAQEVGICDRTLEVRTAIVEATEAATCAQVTQLQLRDVTALDVSDQGIASLSAGDFDGLHRLDTLDLSDNNLTTLPAGIFDELYSLTTLRLHDNDIASLPANIFDQLFVLETLTLHGNELTELPEGMFDDLSRFGGVHLDQDVQGLDRLRAFVEAHSVTTVEGFIEALPPLHKERVVMIYHSQGLGAEHVSSTHPRVVSWGASGEFVFAWLTNPDAPDKFKESVEFLIPGATSWTAGIIDFSGKEPQISHPASCQTCHGTLSKPLFSAAPWSGTELDLAHNYGDRVGQYHVNSQNPRIAPLDLDPPADSFGASERMLPNHGGVTAYDFAAFEASEILVMRHVEVLLGNLKQRDDYKQFAEDAVCAADPPLAVRDAFLATDDHTLAVMAHNSEVVGLYPILAYSQDYYNYYGGVLRSALLFLLLHDLWEAYPAVRDVYRATLNTDAITVGFSPGGITSDKFTAEHMLLHPPGEANVEDELLQLYRLNFGFGNGARIAAVDSHNPTHLQDGSFIVDFESAHTRAMAPRVCTVLREASLPRNVSASVSDGTVTLSWDAPSNADSVSGYRVFRSTDSATEGTSLTDNTITVRTYVDASADLANTYHYRVKAVHGTDRVYTSKPVEVVMPADPNAPGITSGSSFTVTEGETAVGTLTATDADTTTADLTWSLSGGADRAKFAITSAGALSFTAVKDYENPDDADTDGNYQVTAQVSDGANTDAAALTVTLTNKNEAPSAEAGDDQAGVGGGDTVTLSGSGTDPDADDTLSYAWTQTGGTTVTLSGGTTATATFTAPPGLTADAVLTFTLKVTDEAGLYHEDTVSVAVTASPALTAAFEQAPDSHDGSAGFTVGLRFSEEVSLSYRDFTRGLLTVTGGSVDRAGRVTSGSNLRWWVRVTPTGENNVVVTLPANRACDASVTVCTPDGDRLSQAATVTVAHAVPDTSAALTAAFSNAPDSHNGSSRFTVNLRFSEEVSLSFRDFTRGLLTVTGGTVAGARRLTRGSNVGWLVRVVPAGNNDVVMTLPANRACDASVTVCTPDGDKLSQVATVTVPGP